MAVCTVCNMLDCSKFSAVTVLLAGTANIIFKPVAVFLLHFVATGRQEKMMS